MRAARALDSDIPLRIYGDWALTSHALREAGIDHGIPVVAIGEQETLSKEQRLVFVDVGTDPETGDYVIGAVSRSAGRAALAAIDAAVTAVEQGLASGIVTAPINKTAIQLAGATAPGHTEILAARAGLHRYGHDHAMYFDSPTLRVALLTVHVAISEVPESVTAENVFALARLVDREIERLDGKRPKIAVAGLNPHAGEGGLFGTEEEQITRGVERAREAGIDVHGPLAADTAFLAAHNGRYDLVLAMYHDQGLIPVKTLHFQEAVNVTLGLPYLRASVDHGTAFDIAGKGIADPAAMKYAIQWAIERLSR